MDATDRMAPGALRTCRGAACALVLVALLALAAPARAAPAPVGADGVNVTAFDNSAAGIGSFPSLRIIHLVIMGDPQLKAMLSKPGEAMTGFVADDAAVRNLLKRMGKWGGMALQNRTLMTALSNYMIVPGPKIWTTQELAAAAPLQLKTRGGDLLSITKDPSAPRGILVNGYKITLHDHATSDRKALLNSLDGVLIPPSVQPLVNGWIADAEKTRQATAAAGAVEESGPKPVDAGAAAAAPGAPQVALSGAARRAGVAGAGAAAAVAALLSALL